MANRRLGELRVAFLQGLPSRDLRRSNCAPTVTCSHRQPRRSSATRPMLSVVAAAAISLPLVSGEREGPQHFHRKLVPAVAAAAVASSLLLRRRPRSSRTVLPKPSPDTSNIDSESQQERTEPAHATSGTEPWVFDGSRQEWSSSDGRVDDTSSFETRYEPNRSSPTAHDSTQGQMENDTNTTRQPAVGMDTASIFSHMRAEFNSAPSIEEQQSTQGGSSFPDEEEPSRKIRRPPTTNLQTNEIQAPILRHPSSISAADVLRWFVRAPMFLLSDVIVPIAQVSSILWYDCKQWILGARNQGQKLYFMEDTQQHVDGFNSSQGYDGSPWDWEELDVELTPEEKQLKAIQDNMRTMFGHVYGTFRKLVK